MSRICLEVIDLGADRVGVEEGIRGWLGVSGVGLPGAGFAMWLAVGCGWV